MTTLVEVAEAKALMTEAVDWSVMKWLREKKRVRNTADQANEALWAEKKEVKSRWNEDLRRAYDALGKVSSSEMPARNTSVSSLAARIRQADDEAYRAHLDAEDTFARAEKILSTSMAREGCRKAIRSWELYEKAILAAEAGTRTKSTSLG